MTGNYTAREMVAVFDDREPLESAVEELQSAGFDRRHLSLLANRDAVEQKLGEKPADVRDITDDANVPRREPVETAEEGNLIGVMVGTPAWLLGTAAAGAVALSGGTLGGIAIAALIGAGGGGALGGVLAKTFSDRVGSYFEGQLQRGGILLWVTLPTARHEEDARTILSRHSSGEVEVHPLKS